ncbi:hypothetical protein AKJ65_05850 [candidate division MSBL1 archaeon SCGC-AAA259E19]|uniref:Uncharacterized protein n=1 Tax=candidate division MSBL1 archaeon SCGC-AAA259E19 TaxID=1698264 RepID=A0A133UI19_9EURY|nr:hypothetical protein AKJ65_05850 [candidate division MSBL1 archaeon SCGC-AAA259E19]
MYEVDEESARRELEEFNEWILDELFSSKDLMTAIDFTVIPYYGEENPALVSDSRLPGPISDRNSPPLHRDTVVFGKLVESTSFPAPTSSPWKIG